MPYVPVPKDLTKVKTKLAFNLTKRQLICFSLAGLVGLPVYFFTRGAIGNSAAVLLMIGLMMPFFFFAMYERDGQPAEKILKNRLRYKLWPKNRPYRITACFPVCKKPAPSFDGRTPGSFSYPYFSLPLFGCHSGISHADASIA